MRYFNETRIGHYQLPVLSIRLGPREIQVKPISRDTIGTYRLPDRPHGRVDITNGVTTYRLYRLKDDQNGRWSVLPR